MEYAKKTTADQIDCGRGGLTKVFALSANGPVRLGGKHPRTEPI